jgi:hypothetical protein
MSLHIRTPDQNQGKVYDIADPDRHGKIIREGEQQSEIKFDDGAERVVPNAHLRQVGAAFVNTILDALPGAKTDELSQHNPSPVSDVVRLGREAMARKRRGWEDWLAIADALEVGRADVLRAIHSNVAHGRRFEKAMGNWLIANGFKEIDKGTRSRLGDCLRHKVQIQAWRARLTDSERFKFNHPDTILRKWKASTVVPDPNKPKTPSPYQKLQAEHMALIEERDLLKRAVERGGGDLWRKTDRPKDISKVMIAELGKTKAEKVAREILAALKEAK